MAGSGVVGGGQARQGRSYFSGRGTVGRGRARMGKVRLDGVGPDLARQGREIDRPKDKAGTPRT